MIDRFHVQCYGSFSKETYESIIRNDWQPEKIIMGMLSGQFTKDTFSDAVNCVKECLHEYPSMGGVFVWEYIDSPPDEKDPSQWCKLMRKCGLL